MVKQTDTQERLEHVCFTVDSYADGVTFGRHKNVEDIETECLLTLDLKPELAHGAERFEYNAKDKVIHDLERHLMTLSRRGILRRSVIYFGTVSDPFHPFDAKFDASMKMLSLFQRYQPGMLHIQTRSPLLVLAMPVLQSLGKHVAVTVGVETHVEQAVRAYTPDLPQVGERLKMVRTLRRFGIEVNLQVAPVLPYGDWEKDAEEFAKVLIGHADGIRVAALTDGTEKTERQLRGSRMVQKLAHDRQFHYLRRDSATPLLNAIDELSPGHLLRKERKHLSDKQLDFFAA